STHIAPTKRSALAPSSPSCSEPAIGCPPTKRAARSGRAASTAVTTGYFTDPTSVTVRAPASSASTTTSATLPTGTATTTRSALATASATLAARVSTAPASFARAARVASSSNPTTSDPSLRSARPTDPPMSPVPSSATRRGGGMLGLLREIGAELRRAVEEDVPQLVARLVGIAVDEHTDAPRHAVRHVLLHRAEPRHIVETESSARCTRRELRVEIGRGREDDAHHVVRREIIAGKELLDETCGLRVDLFPRVLVTRDGAPHGLQFHDERG